MNINDAEIITVLHKSSHFAAVSVSIHNKSVSEIIVYDGRKSNAVAWWNPRLRCLLKKRCHPNSDLTKARRYSSDDFSGIDFINQPSHDNSNCGPIAAMVLLCKFLPEDIDYRMSVPAFRGFLIKKLLHMLDDTSTV